MNEVLEGSDEEIHTINRKSCEKKSRAARERVHCKCKLEALEGQALTSGVLLDGNKMTVLTK